MMKAICTDRIIFFILVIIFFISCKKEKSCEGCNEKNKPPIAVAGPDQVITLPTDSVLLDGRTSGDPDGIISSFLWTKISGPSSFNIVKPSDSVTKVKTLVTGIYLFGLKVTDDEGLSAEDTVQITVNDAIQSNHPPVSDAGTDQIITLPKNTISIDGTGSADPDNNITSYAWTKISGPSSFNITNANAVQTQVTNLTEGTYHFELKVTDAGGLFDKDTMQVTVQPAATTNCDISNRPLINAQLVQIGTLSLARFGLASAAINNKILFAGGQSEGGYPSRVDIYDIVTNTWAVAELSREDRLGMAAATVGTKVLFAGGIENDNGIQTSRVDIYDASTNSWSQAELSKETAYLSAATVGNKVLFAGGYSSFSVDYPSTVDIYDNSTNTWSTVSLGTGRNALSATAAGNKVYFAGGVTGPRVPTYSNGTLSDKINIYDNATNTWDASLLSEAKADHAAIAFGNKIYWAGGYTSIAPNPYVISNHVEIKDVVTGTTSFECLFQPNADFKAIVKNNKIVFFTGGGTEKNKFDIYDTSTGKWSIGVMPLNIEGASIISVNNTIYVAGGFVNGVLSNEVYKLEF